MTIYQEFNQLQAFARIDGVKVAVAWVMSFACAVGTFSYPLLSHVAVLLALASVVFASLCVKTFRDRVRDGYIGFGQAFAYGVLIYLYASLLFALAQYLYFAFMDNGYFVGNLLAVMHTDEYMRQARAYGLNESDVELFSSLITQLRPIEIALQFFTVNVTTGVIVSLPIAVMIRRKPRNFRNKIN